MKLGREHERAPFFFEIDAKTMRMRLLSEFNLFAGEYQFFAYDSKAEMCPKSLDEQHSEVDCYGWDSSQMAQQLIFSLASSNL